MERQVQSRVINSKSWEYDQQEIPGCNLLRGGNQQNWICFTDQPVGYALLYSNLSKLALAIPDFIDDVLF